MREETARYMRAVEGLTIERLSTPANRVGDPISDGERRMHVIMKPSLREETTLSVEATERDSWGSSNAQHDQQAEQSVRFADNDNVGTDTDSGRESNREGAGSERASRAWSVDSSITANEENELATIRVRTMYGCAGSQLHAANTCLCQLSA